RAKSLRRRFIPGGVVVVIMEIPARSCAWLRWKTYPHRGKSALKFIIQVAKYCMLTSLFVFHTSSPPSLHGVHKTSSGLSGGREVPTRINGIDGRHEKAGPMSPLGGHFHVSSA